MAPPVIAVRFKLAPILAFCGLPLAAACSGAGASAGPSTPSLSSLVVSASADAGALPVALVPPFAPDVHDYYVRCASETRSLTVSMTASEGAESLLVAPGASPSAGRQTVSVTVSENQAIVAAATSGSATTEYWVRCLPHDFPQYTWTPHPEAGTPSPGFYLVGTGAFLGPGGMPASPTSGCFAMVLDGNGVPVWYRRASWANGFCVFDVDQVVPGAISYDSIGDSPAQFEVHAMSPVGATSVEALASTGPLNVDLHELKALPGGDFLLISSPAQPGVDLTGLNVPLPGGGSESLSGPQTILGCDLLEVRPDGSVAWSWRATDHFDPVAVSVAPTLTTAGPFGKNLVDPFHCNSIDIEPGTGNLLVSAREMSSIFEVERSTGRVLWKMGGADSSKDGAAYISVADPFAQQHDARFGPDWVPASEGGSGSISLFDDQSYTSMPSRAVVYQVSAGKTATVAWQHRGVASSPAMGSFRIGADGSRVIGWGMLAGGGFAEVDSKGDDLLDFAFSDGNTTYRAIKVPDRAFDLNELRSTAGIP
ncbi:MAG: arylsulfotransferase family protein [Polyangiaceae bacterium]